jgi:hypothetical protein
MRMQNIPRVITVAAAGFAAVNAAYASFHVMQIEQVIGGVGGDTSAQAIQLRMRASGQNLVSFTRLIVRDAAGLNPIIVKDMTTDVSNFSAGARVLIVSSTFLSHTSPTVVPDFIMTQPIPASYLAAGRLTYEDDGGTIYWSLSWGGANYTGSNLGQITNDADGNFGPPYGGVLPSSSRKALKFTGAASALSVNNAADYALSADPATFINNTGNSFTVISTVVPSITAINQETNGIRVTWTTLPGKTNSLQRTIGAPDGSYSTNFADIFIVTNVVGSTTNYLDIGAVTNFPASYYRVRFTP